MPLVPDDNQPSSSPDVWQPPPIKRTTAWTLVAAVATIIAGLTGGSSYLGNATADTETRLILLRVEDAVDAQSTRLDKLEGDVSDIKLDVRDIQRDTRNRRADP